jgi:type I restriction enzyme, S subunit
MILVKKGDLIISGINVEKGAMSVYQGDEDVIATIHYSSYEFDISKIDIDFLKYFLKSVEFKDALKEQVPGGIKTEIKPKHLLPLEVEIPIKITDQKTLVKNLNLHFSHIDNLFSEQSHQLELIKKLRQQILKDAMQGKLVNQNTKDEPASKLLERIKVEKAKSEKKEKPLPEIKPDEIPFDIPESWVWSRFGQIVLIQSNLVSPFEFLDYPHIAPDNIQKNTGKLLNYKTVREDDVKSANHYFYSGQLIYSKVRPKLNKVIRVNFEGLCSADMYPLKPLIDTDFIKYCMLSSYFLEEVDKFDNRVKMPKINQNQLSLIPVPFPPLSEQKRIVSKIEELMTLCDELEASVKANQEYTTLLYQTALKEALQPKTFEVKQEDLAIAAEPKTEYKNGKVIELPRLQEKEESHFVKRKVLATYIINQSLDDQQFGDVKFEKLLYLSDYFAIKRNLGQNYYQKVAGPLDNSFTIQFFEQIEKSKWFNRKKIGRQFQFSKAVNHSKSLNTYSYFSDEELAKVQKLIDYFKKSDYEKPEIISTLYAVWNNRIIKQQPITDALIKQDFLDWDENKAKYKDRLDGALAWMRKEGVVPDGWGKVIEKPKTKKKK